MELTFWRADQGPSSPTVKALLSRSDLPTPVLYAAGRIITAAVHLLLQWSDGMEQPGAMLEMTQPATQL